MTKYAYDGDFVNLNVRNQGVINGNLSVVGNLDVDGNFIFGDAATDDLTVNGDLVVVDDQYLRFGTDEDVSFEYDEDGDDLLLITGADMRIEGDSGAQKLYFRDSGISINSSADGQLDLVSDSLIKTTGAMVQGVTTKTSDEDVDGTYFSFIELDGNSNNVELTKLVATQGQKLVITCSDSSNTTTVTAKSGTTLNGTNDKATFDASGETLVLYAISDTQFIIVENIGSVSLSST